VQVVLFEARIVFAQDMNLRRGYAGAFELMLNEFEVIEIVADVVVAFHNALSLLVQPI
jgi:hypothetical protein